MFNKDLNPNCEFKHCRSFFQQNYTEMKWSSTPLPFEFASFQYRDTVKIKEGDSLQIRDLKVYDNYLVYDDQDQTFWLDYENSIIDQLQDSKGIRLVKCFDQVEFYSESHQWFKLLKRHTIQSDFQKQYVLIKKISKGRFTEVYRAKNNSDGNDYAVKILKKSSFIDEADLISLFKEIKILRIVQTEFCVKFNEIFENSDNIYIVIELLIGKDLDGHIEKCSFFSEEKTARFIFRLIKTISYLHSKGIMHRDIKPENIIFRQIDNLDSICLTDFGLADFYHSDGLYLFKRCGTPGYIAPEILRNEPYDYKVDVYSIGVIMYYVLVGKNPFDNINSKQILINNQLGQINFNDCKLSNTGLQFLKCILNDDQNERLSSHEALNHIWFQLEKVSKIRQFVFKKKSDKKKHQSSVSLQKKKERTTLKYNNPPLSPTGKITLTQIYSPYHSRQLSQKDQFSQDLQNNYIATNRFNQYNISNKIQPLFISKFK
ncbi:unnamed protein product [Paramecium pentaurelia]|uniref:Protein kinase domain-containing protein n=1 Tax=Paramecium pentaurelia TaxID=43138 RepID=A0A8S1TG87_9CILI|nr:unnamed protein product [Paramecium pentaurelia]